MKIIPCNYSDHAEAILALFNDAILQTTALFIYEPRTMDFMQDWFATKEQENQPIIGAIDDCDNLLGFASFGPFRPQAAYKYTVEHSVYVDKLKHGKGLGTKLMKELIKTAEQQQYHAMIAAVDATNTGSIALHSRLGFNQVGTIKEAAFKFGQWRDMTLFQLLLNTPDNPCDG